MRLMLWGIVAALGMLVVGVVVSVVVGVVSVRGEEPATQRAKIKIVLAGDSTMAVNSGWGPGFMKCLTPDVECINMARGGRSSKSFIREGLWKKCLELKPDYVFIQFGHNDQPGHPGDRETDPNTTYRQYMTQYVDEARAAGIKPVLITSLSRRQWGADGKIHSTLIPNVEVVKQIAAAKHVPLLDLHQKSIDLYEKLGKEEIEKLSPMKPAGSGEDIKKAGGADGAATQKMVYDGTHLNAKGSAVIGKMVADMVKEQVPALAPYIK